LEERARIKEGEKERKKERKKKGIFLTSTKGIVRIGTLVAPCLFVCLLYYVLTPEQLKIFS